MVIEMDHFLINGIITGFAIGQIGRFSILYCSSQFLTGFAGKHSSAFFELIDLLHIENIPLNYLPVNRFYEINLKYFKVA
jgi:hypothetical protein